MVDHMSDFIFPGSVIFLEYLFVFLWGREEIQYGRQIALEGQNEK